MPARDFDGYTALVTGAARNIGREIAVGLARQGADVLVHTGHDRAAILETARMVEAVDRRAIAVTGDLADPSEVDRVVSRAVDGFGGLDIVVNNAAIRPDSSIDDLSYTDWRRVLSVCLDAAFLVSKAALPSLRRSAGGTICNIGGMTGHTGAPNRAHVVAAKAGLSGLTRALAHDLAPDGITVKCVVPGLIDTQRNAASGRGPGRHSGRSNLLDRRGGASEVADMVLHVCGPRGRYVTGQAIHVSGGAYLG